MRKNTTYSNRPNHAARAAHARGSRKFRTYDTSYIRPKKRKMPIILAAVAAVVLIVVIALVAFQLASCNRYNEKAAQGGEVTFTVNEGDTGNTVADNLLQAGLISNAAEFRQVLATRGESQNIKPGEYLIVPGSSLDKLVDTLIAGPRFSELSVPEGYTVAAIASDVQKASSGAISESDFLKEAANVDSFRNSYSFLSSASSLEGFLFPKTYTLHKDETAHTLIQQMLDQFKNETQGIDFSYPKSLGLNDYQVLVFASIVEKESDAYNRKKIAGVFYNRLTNTSGSTKGFLQSDATTAYVVGHDPSPDEVHADNPYSTYTNKGLPPTPICNPGREAIQAACNPDKNIINEGYLYFYAHKNQDGNTQYYFSKTLEEHNAVIAQNS